MWCPSASLSVWANAWFAGLAAPDDVVDALLRWAPRQSVAAHDAVSAGSAGLPWPGEPDGGPMSLLQTLRSTAGGPAAGGRIPRVPIQPVFPVSGDVRGLPAGTVFERGALTAEQAVIAIGAGGSTAVGLVPEFTDGDFEDDGGVLHWTVYALPGTPPVGDRNLGDAEYALRSAVRSAAEMLGSAAAGWVGAHGPDPRLRIEQLVECTRHHRVPDHAPQRAVRVLESAAQVDAIVTVSFDLTSAALSSSSELARAAEALQPLAGVVRSARGAAIDAILHSAWQG